MKTAIGSSSVQVAIHSSQFPEAVAKDLARSLRRRAFNHKFHYESPKQVMKWIELHRRYSPFRRDPACLRFYQRAFAEYAASVRAPAVELISLGCGSGEKDMALARRLRASGVKVFYTPTDVSVGMVITAWRKARKALGDPIRPPLVFDLATARDLRQLFAAGQENPRVFAFFGLIPNFEPRVILPRLARLCRPGDALLVGANLISSADLATSVRKVLPQYDNPATREWFSMALSDLGIEARHGVLCFTHQTTKSGGATLRIQADFRFTRDCRVRLSSGPLPFRKGHSLRVFFSDRYTPERLKELFAGSGFETRNEWIYAPGEEGILNLRKIN